MPPKTSQKAPLTTPKSVQKPTPKPPKPVLEQLKRHFNSLCAQIDGGYFKNAIKTCDKILRLEPRDKEALATKLFLLIQTDQYDLALERLKQDEGDSTSLEPSHKFEKAYLLYRLQKEVEAAEMLGVIRQEGESRASLHLEAQTKYRQGDYEAAREIYNDLLDSCPEDTEEHADLVTNLNATQAHIDFLQTGYLTSLNALDISVAALEEAGAPQIPGPSTFTAPQQPAHASTSATAPAQTTTKPPRKSRIPKHVVPGVTPMPDPERWLKKKERTSYRTEVSRGGRKGKKKEGMGAGSTQGIVLPPLERDSGAATTARSSTPVGNKRGKKGR